MMDSVPPVHTVAVSHGRIAALGADGESVAREAPPGAEILHFPNGAVLPGFWDTHVHVASFGAALASCWLYDAASIDEIVSRLADHAGRNPHLDVVAGRAGNLDPAALAEGRLPTAADLDRAERERPVVVSDVNKCVGNTAALSAAGLSGDAATGVAWFGDKARLEKLTPRARPESYAERFVAGLDALAALGITTVVDGYASIEQIEAIRRLDAAGRLACRVIVQPPGSSEEQLRAFEASGLEFGQELGPRSRVGPVKLFFDRFVMHRSARMSEPYEGEPDNVGGYFVEPEALARRLRAVMDRGFPAAVHVTGDRGVAELLDVFGCEVARRSDAPAGSYLIHGYFPPPGAPERMAELGLGLAAQPPFLYHWADTLERFVGRKRAEHFYPLDRYLAAGVAVAGGSDGPVADPNPLLGIYAATTRRSASGRVWGPEHALPMSQALALYTECAARLFAWSGFPGRLAVGQPADFVVLDRDPAATGAADVRSLRVLATFVGGRRSYP